MKYIYKMKRMRIGMRTIKTTIAVLLTIIIAHILKLQSPLLAGIAAIVTMQSNIINSIEEGKSRLLGTVFGAIVGILFALIAPGNLLLVGIGMIVVIIVCNHMDWEDSIIIALIVFLSMMIEQKEGQRLSYTINRTIDTFLGVLIASIINVIISPPDIEKRAISTCRLLLDECDKTLDVITTGSQTHDLDNIRSQLQQLHENYQILKNESKLTLHKKNIKCENIEHIKNQFESLYIDLYTISNTQDRHIYTYHLSKAEETLNLLKKKLIPTTKKQKQT